MSAAWWDKYEDVAKGPWLIQRLEKPYPSDSLMNRTDGEPPFTFGAGGSGIPTEGWKIIRQLWSYDYMGAAEFEFGTPSQVLKEIVESRNELVSFSVIIKASEIKDNYERESEKYRKQNAKRRKEEYQAPAFPKKKDATVYIICRKRQAAYAEDLVRHLAGGHVQLKEPALFNDAVDPIDERDRRHCGWIEYDNGLFFFTDEEMWKRVAKVFLPEKADGQSKAQ